MEGAVTVTLEGILTIQAGVEVLMKGSAAEIVVENVLRAEGSDRFEVKITGATPSAGSWKGISFSASAKPYAPL